MIIWKLDAVMQARGVKGRELARRMNIGENYLSRVRHEVPDRLSLTLLDALCRELECDLADLLEYQGPARSRRAAPAGAAGKRGAKSDKAPARGPRRLEKSPPRPAPASPPPELRATPSGPNPEPVAPIPVRPTTSAAVSLRLERRVPAAVRQADELSPFYEEVLGPLMAELSPGIPQGESEPRAGAAGVLKNSALQARLERLKKRRPLSS